MRSRRLSVSIPEPVLDALYAEGSRTYETPGQVAARVLREALPHYVERRLRSDLAPVIRARVIEVQMASQELEPGLSPGTAATLAVALESPATECRTERNLVASDHEAPDGVDSSKTYAEHNPTARSALKDRSGGSRPI